jgi:hypothetical protein
MGWLTAPYPLTSREFHAVLELAPYLTAEDSREDTTEGLALLLWPL